ncbi:MAG: DUF4197 domain-containing protein [Burkholderiales bacterium]
MYRLMLAGCAFALSLCAQAGLLDQVSQTDMTTGLKDSLQQGAVNAISKLGQENGFFNNAKVKIPLPKPMQQVEKLMRTFGMKKQADDLVLSMNRAAEAAVPEAKELFVGAVKAMSVQDAYGILKGGEDSATRYFRKSTEDPLRGRFLPIVVKAIEKVGVAQRYNAVAGKAAKLGLIKDNESNVEDYVTQKALDGLYVMMADEEKAIRANPLKAGTEIAKKIFDLLRK